MADQESRSHTTDLRYFRYRLLCAIRYRWLSHFLGSRA
jgi:hypothetical protein